ncbi:hypothetical protein F383_33056 [Gossypium arboreum]
MNHM